MGASQPVESVKEDKVGKILSILGISNLDKASKSDLILALGRLLSLKIERGTVHEVTKEVRRSLEIIIQSPLTREINMAVYTNPPFESSILNDAYRKLLKKLLEVAVSEATELSPMWRRRLVNLIVENIYNVATAYETIQYKKQILDALKEG